RGGGEGRGGLPDEGSRGGGGGGGGTSRRRGADPADVRPEQECGRRPIAVRRYNRRAGRADAQEASRPAVGGRSGFRGRLKTYSGLVLKRLRSDTRELGGIGPLRSRSRPPRRPGRRG